ncbi:MAG TPA: bifunctional DNA primase/polymerase, partial [Alphaproteobacteria bacterium]|nr:bifunctional DNA primase/polymerase [Alphaproteobacteria bacterium]
MNDTDAELAVQAVREAAYAWQANGFSVVPVQEDGTKRPLGTWKQYQREAASRQQVSDWFASGQRHGLGLICGAISGGLEMFELEGRAVAEGARNRLVPALEGAGIKDLWRRLLQGYCEFTPSGGIHLLYRIADREVPGNTKIARRPATAEELATDPDNKVHVL